MGELCPYTCCLASGSLHDHEIDSGAPAHPLKCKKLQPHQVEFGVFGPNDLAADREHSQIQ